MDNNLQSKQTSKDLELLNKIEQDPEISQASLADELGVAVGTINWYLKRLISKGYIKVKRAQRKKLLYIITPEGIALRTRLTVDYIQNSFELYRHIRMKTRYLLQELRQNGYTQVKIDGSGDIAEVCRLTCLEQNIHITEDPISPRITIQGFKLILELPDDARNEVSACTHNRQGDHE